MSLFVTTDAVSSKEGCDDAGELHGSIGTILIVVHAGTAAGGPLIGAVQIDVYLLTATEGITTGDTHSQLRTHTSDGTRIEYGFHIKVPRLVERAVQCQVEGIAGCSGIAGGKLELGHGEQTHRIDLADGLQIVAIAIELAGAQLHVGHQHTRTDRWLLASKTDGEEATAKRVSGLFHECLAHVDIDAADIPFMLGSLWHVVGQLEAQLCLTIHHQGVGKVRGIAGLKEIIAVVA